MAVAAMAVIGAGLVPGLAPLFENSGKPPPAFLRWASALSEWGWQEAAVALAMLALGTAGVIAAFRDRRVRLHLDWLVLRLPLLGRMSAQASSARLLRLLGAMVKAGVPLVTAVELSGPMVGNRCLRRRFEGVAEAIRRGGRLSAALQQCGDIPPMALRLAAVGEETGRLADLLLHAAAILEAGGERALDRAIERARAMRRPERDGGFTLLELLVVLAIAAGVAALALPALRSPSPAIQIEATARNMAAALRSARLMALSRGRDAWFTRDLAARRYTADGAGKSGSIPTAFAIRMIAARSQIDAGSVGRVRFFPDGGSTGGRIELTGSANAVTIDVDWLTGRVSLEHVR
jgi:type II secretion system protein H